MSTSPIIEFASGAFFIKRPAGEPTGAALTEKARQTCEKLGFRFGSQIHNTATTEQLDQLHHWQVPLSFHAPIMTDYLINLGAEDDSISMECIQATRAYAEKYSVDSAVFHGFFMTDKPIPAFGRGKNYNECLKDVRRPELSIGQTNICSDFYETDEFHLRYQRVKRRLETLRKQSGSLRLLIENDCPVMGSGLPKPDHVIRLGNPICLDTSHLWFSSKLFNLSFHDEVEKMLESGLVEMVHFHASPFSQVDTPLEKWSDGHLNLSTPNTMDLPRLARACREAGIKRIVFEFNDASEQDIHIFADMWNA